MHFYSELTYIRDASLWLIVTVVHPFLAWHFLLVISSVCCYDDIAIS